MKKWSCDYMNKLVEREAFIDSMRVKSAELKYNFCSSLFRLSVFLWCNETVDKNFIPIETET